MINYLIANKEWVFSGVGVMALGGAAAFARFVLFSRKGAVSSPLIRQSQKSGHSSKNTQIGAVNLLPPDRR
jgi:hypothetical protein